MEMREEEQTAVTQHVTALGTEMDSGRYAQHLGENAPFHTRASGALTFTRPWLSLCDCGVSRITAETGFPRRLMTVLKANVLAGQL